MSLALLFPLGLLALGAWALPLLLHLARREQRTPTDFAALRWLAIRQKPRSRLRFDEILLLVLRLALLAALALVLARPALTGGAAGQAWEAVHPALAAPVVTADDGVQRRWLAPGFPSIDQPRPDAAVPTSSLVRQLDAELPAGASLTIHVPTAFDGADGERPRLSRRIDWRVSANTREAPTAASATAATAAPAATAATTATDADPSGPRLVIRHDEAHVAQEPWLRAVASAWQAGDIPIDSASVDAALPDGDTFVLAWLADGSLPAPVRQWIEGGGTALLAVGTTWPLAAPGTPVGFPGDGVPAAVAAVVGRGRVVQLRHALQPAAWPALLEASFPQTLRTLVTPPPPAPARADAATHAPLEGGPGFAAAPRELFDAMAWVVLALFALERFVATGRRREPGA